MIECAIEGTVAVLTLHNPPANTFTAAGLLQLEENKTTHYGQSSHGQKDEAPLQELVKGESKEVETKIDLEKRVGNAE